MTAAGELVLPAIGEGHGCVKLWTGDMIVDNVLRFHDLPGDDLILIVAAVGAVHHKPSHTIRSHVHLVNRGREAARPPPVRHMFRIGPQFEHQPPRGGSPWREGTERGRTPSLPPARAPPTTP